MPPRGEGEGGKVLPSMLVLVTGGQIRVLRGEDKSGKRLMSGLSLQPEMVAKSL